MKLISVHRKGVDKKIVFLEISTFGMNLKDVTKHFASVGTNFSFTISNSLRFFLWFSMRSTIAKKHISRRDYRIQKFITNKLGDWDEWESIKTNFITHKNKWAYCPTLVSVIFVIFSFWNCDDIVPDMQQIYLIHQCDIFFKRFHLIVSALQQSKIFKIVNENTRIELFILYENLKSRCWLFYLS